MAITITKLKRPQSQMLGNVKLVFADLTLDNAYPTDGYAISAGAFGARDIFGVSIIGGNAGAGTYNFAWNESANKLMAFKAGGATAAFAETANNTDLSAIILRVIVWTAN
mgnify:FL=1|jgi:hypothetical protein